MKLLRAGPFKRGCKAAPFEWTIPKKKKRWHSVSLWKTTDVHRGIILSTGAKSLKSLCLTNIVHKRRPGVAIAVDDSTPGDPNLKGHAALAVVLPKGDSHPAARPVTTHVMDALTHMTLVRQIHRTSLPCSNLSAWPNLAPTCARLFLWKETGTSNTAAALIGQGFAAIPHVTIGVTNADVTSNSAVDDGAASQGMDCT
ncbi:hypothetical protein [Pseudomonas piscis]|uniref:hypothetical protein n=1 Tax=Pseudomonas piscis TaxID=2614538 RepID=UPI001F446768|nr:hypothetical protein [Pseudomonas piscis]